MIPRRLALAAGLLSAGIAAAQVRLILLVLGAGFGHSLEAGMGVLQGRPHWRAYQPRVLGPLLVDLLSTCFATPVQAYAAYAWLTLTATGVLALWLGWRLVGTVPAALAVFGMIELGFALLLHPLWLYPWDFLDLIVFLVFAEFVASGRSWLWFLGLLLVGIYVRQSVVLVGLWMIMQALVPAIGRQGKIDRAMLISGLAGLAASLAILGILEHSLFIEEIGPKLFSDAQGADFGPFRLQLMGNLAAIRRLLTAGPDSAILLPPALLALAAIRLLRLNWRRYGALVVTGLGLFAEIMLFGVLDETRVMLDLLPMIALGALAMR